MLEKISAAGNIFWLSLSEQSCFPKSKIHQAIKI